MIKPTKNNKFLVIPETKRRENFENADLTCTMCEKVWDKSEKVWDMSVFISTLNKIN